MPRVLLQFSILLHCCISDAVEMKFLRVDAAFPNSPSQRAAVLNTSVPIGSNSHEIVMSQTEGCEGCKDMAKLVLYSALLGTFGCDRCYLGFYCAGWIKALTLGGLGVWAFIDTLIILIAALNMDRSIDALGMKATFDPRTLEDGKYWAMFWLIYKFISVRRAQHNHAAQTDQEGQPMRSPLLEDAREGNSYSGGINTAAAAIPELYILNRLNDTYFSTRRDTQDPEALPHQPLQSPTEPEGSTAIDEVCTICFAQTSDCVFHPCGHGGLCEDCARRHVAHLKPCPMCRTVIERVIKVDSIDSTTQELRGHAL